MGALQPPVTPVPTSVPAAIGSTSTSPELSPQQTASASGSSASELASPLPPAATATVEEHPTSELVAVHPRELAVDSWAAHRPSSREIAAAWHDIDELQARGQFERSLALLVRLELYAPPSDQDEALFDRARTVQEALRRPRSARALYSEYVRRFPEGRHLQEVRRRLVALGAPAEGDPAPASAAEAPEEPSLP
jgi:tetratricopeptide (TPR) repeat protein